MRYRVSQFPGETYAECIMNAWKLKSELNLVDGAIEIYLVQYFKLDDWPIYLVFKEIDSCIEAYFKLKETERGQ